MTLGTDSYGLVISVSDVARIARLIVLHRHRSPIVSIHQGRGGRVPRLRAEGHHDRYVALVTRVASDFETVPLLRGGDLVIAGNGDDGKCVRLREGRGRPGQPDQTGNDGENACTPPVATAALGGRVFGNQPRRWLGSERIVPVRCWRGLRPFDIRLRRARLSVWRRRDCADDFRPRNRSHGNRLSACAGSTWRRVFGALAVIGVDRAGVGCAVSSDPDHSIGAGQK